MFLLDVSRVPHYHSDGNGRACTDGGCHWWKRDMAQRLAFDKAAAQLAALSVTRRMERVTNHVHQTPHATDTMGHAVRQIGTKSTKPNLVLGRSFASRRKDGGGVKLGPRFH